MPNAADREAWHLRKELSIGTIISLVTLSVAGVYAFAEIKAEVRKKAEDVDIVQIQADQKHIKEDVQDIKKAVHDFPQIKADLKHLIRELEHVRYTTNGNGNGNRPPP